MVAWLHSRRLHELPFTLVLLVELLGLVLVAVVPQHWLRAVGVLSVGLGLAGLFRLLLSDDQAGMLRVRRRSFDVTCYWGFGALALLVALGLPQR
ncbi:MAG TPA: DUF3017 domain-containing protein [Jatrophihabitans sp.]|nr:DUF3017 domain-containing protein [Jatrophihabitans sp.]